MSTAEISGEWEEFVGLGDQGTPPAVPNLDPNGPSEEAPDPLEPRHEVEFMESFPEEWRQDFEGLTYLGHLEATVSIPMHTFVVRTLLPVAQIEIAQLVRELEGGLGYNQAYRSAVVAASLVSVDGKPLPVARRDAAPLREKYLYVINSWYDPIINLLYRAVDALEFRQLMVMQELGIFGDPGDTEGKGTG